MKKTVSNLDDDDFTKMEDDLVEEISSVLGDLAEDKDFSLLKIQPPSSVIDAAAHAAAQVFIAFERGYRMGE